MTVSAVYFNLMKSLTQINFAENIAACNVVSIVTDVRERMDVQLRPVIQQSVVADRPKGAITFFSKMQGAREEIGLARTDSLYNPQLHQLLPVFLSLFSFRAPG